MNKRLLSQLQRLINKTVTAQNAFQRHQAVLMDFCREYYGYEPGDIDADAIIDAVLGGCGVSNGMSAEEFDRIMHENRYTYTVEKTGFRTAIIYKDGKPHLRMSALDANAQCEKWNGRRGNFEVKAR